jgi:hypothetical protein
MRTFEIVLWLEDRRGPGVLDPDEVLVISHTPLLEMIRLYMLPPGTQVPAVTPADAERGGFCALWRADPRVEVRTFATGVAQMQFGLAEVGDLYELALIWSAESADGADAGSVLVDARTSLPEPAETSR